jgi:hypothetical protein
MFSLGGQLPDLTVYETGTTGLVDLGNITFYEIASKTWYAQRESGNVPPG